MLALRLQLGIAATLLSNAEGRSRVRYSMCSCILNIRVQFCTVGIWKKLIAAIMEGKQRKTFWKCYITCLLVMSSMEYIMLKVDCVLLRRFFYTLFSWYYVLYHVVRDGTIVPRVIQFVYHMFTFHLANVLQAQTHFSSLSNCQKLRFVLCNYQINL